MTMNYQDENIALAALLGGIWPINPFMIEIARKTPKMLRDFMDQDDGFNNTKDTLRALTAPRRTELEWANKKIAGHNNGVNQEGNKKGSQEAKQRNETLT